MTVDEAFVFSARLRQPKDFSDAEKLCHVDEALKTRVLAKFANTIIGDLGEGLNIQRRSVLYSVLT